MSLSAYIKNTNKITMNIILINTMGNFQHNISSNTYYNYLVLFLWLNTSSTL